MGTQSRKEIEKNKTLTLRIPVTFPTPLRLPPSRWSLIKFLILTPKKGKRKRGTPGLLGRRTIKNRAKDYEHDLGGDKEGIP